MFVVGRDRRKKCAQRRAEQELQTVQQMLDNIIEAFNAGDKTQLDCLLFAAREYHSRRVIQDDIITDTEQVCGALQIFVIWPQINTFPLGLGNPDC